MNIIIENNIVTLKFLCKKYKVTRLFVFGSVLSNKFSEKSDIDFLVYFNDDIPLLDYSDNYFNLKFALEDLFKKNIDLSEGNALKNKYFIEEVESTKQLIYEQESIEVFA